MSTTLKFVSLLTLCGTIILGQEHAAAPEPYIKVVTATEDRVLLQCEVHGASPEPKVEWQDSSGNILPAKEPPALKRGGSYNITLQTTVTKTDRYRCVVTQEEIKHQTHAEIFVYISGPPAEHRTEPRTGWIVAVVVAVLAALLVLLLALLYVKGCIKLKSKKGPERETASPKDTNPTEDLLSKST